MSSEKTANKKGTRVFTKHTIELVSRTFTRYLNKDKIRQEQKVIANN